MEAKTISIIFKMDDLMRISAMGIKKAPALRAGIRAVIAQIQTEEGKDRFLKFVEKNNSFINKWKRSDGVGWDDTKLIRTVGANLEVRAM